MTLTVTGRHLTVSAASRRHIETRIHRVQRLLGPSVVSAQCVVWEERGAHVCEVTMHAGGDHRLHGVGRGVQLTTAVGAAVDKVSAQALRLKDRWTTRRRSAAPTASGKRGGRRPSKPSRRVRGA